MTNPNLFAGRRRELEVIRENIARLSTGSAVAPAIALIGERRVGKTSLLLRAKEVCADMGVLGVLVSLSESVASAPWEFWREVLDGVIDCARHAGILEWPSDRPLGFHTGDGERVQSVRGVAEQLHFGEFYFNRGQMGPAPPVQVVRDDFRLLSESASASGCRGILLMLDEAHLMAVSHDVQQQIRQLVRDVAGFGLIFSGEPRLAHIFNDPSEPLYAQARILPLGNLSFGDEVLECVLLPLKEQERALVSPMTVDYLGRLSRGKPNQVRLICHSIYRRYELGKQDDLHISIEVLDELIDNIESAYGTEYNRQRLVDTIHKLSSSYLECLHNMTRYGDWAVTDIVTLDESFRGVEQGQLATARRNRLLEEKKAQFVTMGLMHDDAERCVLAGDEFLHLYLRFWYEVRKYGELARRLELRKGPATPFGEKVEKLVHSLEWDLRRKAGIIHLTVSRQDAGPQDIVAAVRRRFDTLYRVLNKGEKITDAEAGIFFECFSTCELVSTPGKYHLFVLNSRNLENPQETIRAELYFSQAEVPLVIPLGEFTTIRRQAEAAKVWIEDIDNFVVYLPDLAGLLEGVGLPALDELIARAGMTERWWLQSVRHAVTAKARPQPAEAKEPHKKDEAAEWLELYAKGDADGAERVLTDKLLKETQRPRMARFYNDRGYVRYALGNKKEMAKQDLKRATELHFVHLAITLLNLGVIIIDEGNYTEAIARIEEALFITLSREDIYAGWLRLRVPGTHLAAVKREKWEQQPANVLEAGYINLAFALLRSQGEQAALEAFREGMELLPDSLRLKHALARLYLYGKRANLADPIYLELSQALSQGQVPDADLAREIKVYVAPVVRRMQNRGRRHR